jgi:hypothetical protein
MGPVVVVVVLPFPQLLAEQVDVIPGAAPVEQLIELWIVNPMTPFHLTVQVGCARANIPVVDIQGLDASYGAA